MNKLTINHLPPMSYACAEAVNTLCTNLSFSGEHVKRIMVTSCHADEGKTYTAMNIVATLSKLGKSVVFVDADLRRSVITARYQVQFDDPAHTAGLSHLLAGMVDKDEVVYETNLPGAYMVPVGREVSNSLALLVSPRLCELLDDLAQSADYVIVDAPPLGVLIDAAEIAKSCDGTLIVVNYNSVRHQELLDVKQQLEQTGCAILGAVLNEVAFDNYLSRKYYYKSYYSRYDGYYGRKKEAKGKAGKKERRGNQ